MFYFIFQRNFILKGKYMITGIYTIRHRFQFVKSLTLMYVFLQYFEAQLNKTNNLVEKDI